MRRHTLALTAAAVLVVGAPTAASAQTYRHTDPAGDVTHDSYNFDTDEEVETVDPTIAEGDVIGSTVKHNPRKVITTLTFRELTVTDDLSQFIVGIRSSNKVNRFVVVTADSDHPRGVQQFVKTNGRKASCRGLSHAVDYTANTVTITVPRACLSRPRWVSVGAASERIAADDATTPSDTIDAYIDDAHRTGLGDDITYSPRLRRG